MSNVHSEPHLDRYRESGVGVTLPGPSGADYPRVDALDDCGDGLPLEAMAADLPNEPNSKEKARRSRKDEEGRNYNCGCGKKYLSYPALYTHIRNKHFGKTPEGTRNSASNSSKRGRPKRVPGAADESPEDYSGTCLVELEDLTLLKHLDGSYEGEYDLALDYRGVLGEHLAHYYKMLINREVEERPDPKMPFGLALVLFSVGMSRLLNQSLFQHYVQFLRTLHQCFLNHSNEVLTNCLNSPKMAEIRESLKEITKEELL